MPSFYRCENEHGDYCIFAEENRKIPVSEVTQSMDGSAPKCPGKTRSGKTCGCELVLLPDPPTSWWKKILPVIGGIFVVAIFVWFFTRDADSPNNAKKSLGITTGTTPTVVTPPPVKPSQDPWWVYQQLETSSKILRTEP